MSPYVGLGRNKGYSFVCAINASGLMRPLVSNSPEKLYLGDKKKKNPVGYMGVGVCTTGERFVKRLERTRTPKL